MTRDAQSTMRFLPIGLDVRGRRCIVVGGGTVGTRKAGNLQRAGATVTVVSPTASPELAAAIDAGEITWTKDEFRPEHFDQAFLVVAATDDAALNAHIARAAMESGALVCEASSAERSQVIFGALLEDEGATIAVFTDGQDPAQARRKRDEIARLVRREP